MRLVSLLLGSIDSLSTYEDQARSALESLGDFSCRQSASIDFLDP